MMAAEDLLVDVGEFPFDITSEELPNACRRAYSRIIVGAHIGWGKVELARWLAGPYRRLTLRPTWATARIVPSSDRTTPVPPSAGGVSETRVEKLLADMRADVLLVLRELTTAAGRSAFTTLALDLQLVGRAEDDTGAEIVLPQVRERMSLVDRVLSLVAVDALARSEDFEHSLFVCSRCEQPVFDVHARPNGICRVHVSGVMAR
ncbi:MAG TPA: hypothetical protein VLM85_17075 [Polyangiaceae bacterium]|nr:hypothetical protein [Polyangiaceae bacterium]